MCADQDTLQLHEVIVPIQKPASSSKFSCYIEHLTLYSLLPELPLCREGRGCLIPSL